MSAAPNSRVRLTRYNGAAKSRQHEPVVGSRQEEGFNGRGDVDASMAQVLPLMQQQMAAQQRVMERMAEAPSEARLPAIKIDFEKFRESPRTGISGQRCTVSIGVLAHPLDRLSRLDCSTTKRM